jgi:hypothetical protein
MAINYGPYVESMKQLGQSRGIQPTFKDKWERAFGTPEENYNKLLQGHLNTEISPVFNAATHDIGNWDKIDFQNMSNAGTSWLKFKESVENKGGTVLKYAKDKGLLNPLAFKQNYDAYLNLYVPEIVNRLSTYQMMNKIKPNQMKELVNTHPGLKNLVMNNDAGKQALIENPNALNYFTPQETFKDKWGWSQLSTPFKIAGVGGAAALLPRLRKFKWETPKFGAGPGGRKSILETGKQLLPDKRSAAQKSLDKAKAKYQKFPDKRTLKAKKFKSTTLQQAQNKLDSIKTPKKADARGVWKKLTTKYPTTKGMFQKLVKKVGAGRATWMMAKLGIGSALTAIPEPLSTVAGFAMNASIVYTIAQLLLGDEE